LAGADRERDREVRFAGARFAAEDDRFAVVDPGALGERGDGGLRDGGVVVEAEVLEPLEHGEAGVEQAAALSALGALGDLGFEQGGEVGERRLLRSGGFLGERAEAAAHGGQVQLLRVCLDQCFECGGLRLGAHRAAPRLSRAS